MHPFKIIGFQINIKDLEKIAIFIQNSNNNYNQVKNVKQTMYAHLDLLTYIYIKYITFIKITIILKEYTPCFLKVYSARV